MSDLTRVPLHRLMECAIISNEACGAGAAWRAAAREDLHTELGDILGDAWDGQIDDALKNALKVLLTDPSAVMTDAALQETLTQAGLAFDGIPADVADQVGDVLGEAYMNGRQAVLKPMGMSFNDMLVDGEAQSALESDTMYWIGDYYNSTVGASIADVINSTVIQKGLSREDAGAALEAMLGGDFPDKSRNYWNLVASAGVQRSTVFGGINSFKQARVKTVRFVNPDDYRTSDICEHLVSVGVFPAKYAYQTVDDFLDADTPDEAKEAAPWPDPKLVLGTRNPDALGEIGIVPPLHGYCRSDLVPESFYEQDEKADVGYTGGDADDADGNARSMARRTRRRLRRPPLLWVPRRAA